MNKIKNCLTIAILTLAASITSCEVQEVVTTTYTINAPCESTKTVNDGMSTEWAAGDAMTVFYPNAGSLASARFDYSGSDTFSGRISIPDNEGEWIAVYPYDAALNSAQKAAISLPATLIQSGNNSTAHLAGEGFPLVGKAAGVSNGTPTIAMTQTAAVASFIVKNAEDAPVIVTGIEFTAPVQIAGKFSADLTASEPAWSPVTGQASSTVKLSIAGGQEIASGTSAAFYMGMMPFDQTGDFTIKISGTCNGATVTCTKQLSSRHISLPAGTITKLNLSFSKDASSNPAYVLVTAEPDSWEGRYLVLNQDSSTAYAPIQNVTNYAYGPVSVSNGMILSDGIVDAYAIDVTYRNGDSSTKHKNATDLNAYDVRNTAGQFLYCSGSALQFDTDNQKSGNTYSHAFQYDSSSGSVCMMSSREVSNSTKYYLKYSDGAFSYSTTSSHRVLLYKYTENAEPGGGSDPEEIEPASGHLGTFNLVNDDIRPYLIEADQVYTDDNWSTVTLFYKKSDPKFKYNYGENGDLSQSNTNITAYDRPAPVTIGMEGCNGMTATVSVYNDAAMAELENSVTTTVSNSKIDIYNLIPNKRYYFTTTIGGSVVAEGSFDTEGARRFIMVSDRKYADNANNFRDLGGLATSSGKPLQYGKVFRGTNMDAFLDQTTYSAARSTMMDYLNIRLDVDLRAQTNTSSRNYAKQVLDGNVVTWSHEYFSGETDLKNKAKIKAVFTSILNTLRNDGAAYIHCFAGADRTGYICMLLEAACGVSEKDCTIDYELTSFSCVGIRDRCSKIKSSYMKTMLPYIEGQEGSTFQQKAVKILTDAGLSKDEVAELQRLMTE